MLGFVRITNKTAINKKILHFKLNMKVNSKHARLRK